MIGINPQLQAQQSRLAINGCQAHVTAAQNPRLPQPVAQPQPQGRVTPYHLHHQRYLTESGLLLALTYIEALDKQAVCMPRHCQTLKQVAHALPGRQVPVRRLQPLFGNHR
ncbi:hypothetical protein D3C80_1510960 [compost metagenome]